MNVYSNFQKKQSKINYFPFLFFIKMLRRCLIIFFFYFRKYLMFLKGNSQSKSFWQKCMSKYNFIMLTWKKCVCENAIIVTKCYCILCLNIIYFLLGFSQQISILSWYLFFFKHGNKVIFYAFTNRNAFNGHILCLLYMKVTLITFQKIVTAYFVILA